MPSWFVFLFSFSLIAAETVVLGILGWEQLTFQLGLAIVIVVGLTREFVSGGFIVAALLYPIEWSVAGIPGYYAFALVGVFFILRPIRGRISRLAGAEALVMGALAALIHAGLLMITLALTQPTSPVISAIANNALGSAAMVGLSTLWVAWVFEKIGQKFRPATTSLARVER